jgi:hypothetical protein
MVGRGHALRAGHFADRAVEFNRLRAGRPLATVPALIGWLVNIYREVPWLT